MLKDKKYIVSAVILLVCTIGPIIATLAYESYRTRGLTAEILARTPEKGNFSPRHVKIPLGEKITLRVRNVDTVTHGFAIPALGVDAEEITAGHYKILEFTPEKPGKYDFYCTTWCSEFHLQMRGILEITDK
jgi:heme/copper-type cytochrome/quinol oxidase subunit 2